MFASLPNHTGSSLQSLKTFVRKCHIDFKEWKERIQNSTNGMVIVMASDGNAKQDQELLQIRTEYMGGELGRRDLVLDPIYTKFAVVCYYNTQYFNERTQEKLIHFDNMLTNITQLLEKRRQPVTRSLQCSQFNCLIVGDGRHNPEDFHTTATKHTSAATGNLYRQNFFTLNIPKEEHIEDRIDLIWKEIDKIGRVHSILLLLEDSKTYRKFGGKWEKLVPYTAVVLFHNSSKKPSDEKTINQRHLQRVFTTYAHDIYMVGHTLQNTVVVVPQ